MTDFRRFFTLTCCIVGGIVCLNRYYSRPYSLAELTEITGQVASIETVRRSNKYENETYPLVRLRGVSPGFAYLDWFPEPDKLRTAISIGDTVTIWVDYGRNDWLWQLERKGTKIIRYDDVAAAVSAGKPFDLFFGCTFLFVAALLCRRFVNNRRQSQIERYHAHRT